MSYRYWPLFGLCLSTPDLRLRPMTEADLAPIADLLPEDVALDPSVASYDFGDRRVNRGIVSHQTYWLASGLGDQVEITGFGACLPLFGLPG